MSCRIPYRYHDHHASASASIRSANIDSRKHNSLRGYAFCLCPTPQKKTLRKRVWTPDHDGIDCTARATILAPGLIRACTASGRASACRKEERIRENVNFG
ncbi:hypothetical protein HGRIS_003291 [Hohenbuehelia grisea]|uniref:Uncharacterized protein n=1 Tax=Hohenbuehelia grisea TaxID=104357 RepID=A0ABR3JN05_9AGAR